MMYVYGRYNLEYLTMNTNYLVIQTHHEAVDDCLSALIFVPDWFFIDEMIRNIPEALFTNDDILFFDEDFGNVTFFANQMVKYS